SAYTLRSDDDDFTQPGILVRKVFNDDQRAKLIEQVAGSLLGGVREPVLSRAFEYWKNIDAEVGTAIENKVRAGSATKPAEGMGEGCLLVAAPGRTRCRDIAPCSGLSGGCRHVPPATSQPDKARIKMCLVRV